MAETTQEMMLRIRTNGITFLKKRIERLELLVAQGQTKFPKRGWEEEYYGAMYGADRRRPVEYALKSPIEALRREQCKNG